MGVERIRFLREYESIWWEQMMIDEVRDWVFTSALWLVGSSREVNIDPPAWNRGNFIVLQDGWQLVLFVGTEVLLGLTIREVGYASLAISSMIHGSKVCSLLPQVRVQGGLKEAIIYMPFTTYYSATQTSHRPQQAQRDICLKSLYKANLETYTSHSYSVPDIQSLTRNSVAHNSSTAEVCFLSFVLNLRYFASTLIFASTFALLKTPRNTCSLLSRWTHAPGGILYA